MAGGVHDPVRDAVRELLALDAGVLGEAELREAGRWLVRVRGWLEGVDAALTRRAEGLARSGGGVDGRWFQREHGARSDRGARAAVERAELLGAVPELAAVVEAGTAGVAHVDAVARVVAKAPEAVREQLLGSASWLAGKAASSSPEQLERSLEREVRELVKLDAASVLAAQRARSHVRHWVAADGMHHLHAELDPERGARVFAALGATVERLFHQGNPASTGRAPSGGPVQSALAADALVELCTTSRGAGPGSELVVLIDYESLTAGVERIGGVCETSSGVPLPVSTVRKLWCEADILPVVLGGDGVALDAGRTRRLATKPQRRALRAMHRSCAWPGCTTRCDPCPSHHTDPWGRHGPTDLEVLAPVCSHHHHQIHDLGWNLTLDEHRNVTIHAPDGRTVQRQRFEPIVAPGGASGAAGLDGGGSRSSDSPPQGSERKRHRHGPHPRDRGQRLRKGRRVPAAVDE